MNDIEYGYIQNELSKLLASENVHRKYPHAGYAEAYKRAIHDCKSKLHDFYNHKKGG